MTQRPHGYARYRLDGCRCYVCGWARAVYDDDRNQRTTAGTIAVEQSLHLDGPGRHGD